MSRIPKSTIKKHVNQSKFDFTVLSHSSTFHLHLLHCGVTDVYQFHQRQILNIAMLLLLLLSCFCCVPLCVTPQSQINITETNDNQKSKTCDRYAKTREKGTQAHLYSKYFYTQKSLVRYNTYQYIYTFLSRKTKCHLILV